MIKLEAIPNILNSPKEARPQEIDVLITRRKEECKEFHEKFNSNRNLSETNYLVDIQWFLNWKCFVTNDLTEKHLPNSNKNLSINPSIGVLSPGPITNELLYEAHSLKKNLVQNQDYILVNQHLWNFFFSNYNGGPAVPLLPSHSPMRKTINAEINKGVSPLTSEEKKKSESHRAPTKIILKDEYKNVIQETKVEERVETESIRNEECTMISEGNINEVYRREYNSNSTSKRRLISEKVEVEFPQSMRNLVGRGMVVSRGKK